MTLPLSSPAMPLAPPVHPLRGLKGALDSSKTEPRPCVFFSTPVRAQTCTLIYSHLTVEATVIPLNPPLPILATRSPRFSPSHQFQTFQLLGTGASNCNPI